MEGHNFASEKCFYVLSAFEEMSKFETVLNCIAIFEIKQHLIPYTSPSHFIFLNALSRKSLSYYFQY